MAFTMPDFGRTRPEDVNPMANILSKVLQAYSQSQGLKSNQMALQKTEAELPYAGEMAKQTAAYKAAMAKYLSNPNQMLKNLSPLGKSYVEPGVVGSLMGRQNNNPNMQGLEDQNMQQSNQNSEMEEFPENGSVQDIYGLHRQKLSTDTQTRNRTLFAKNIEKTLGYIDPDDLFSFTGLNGNAKKVKEYGSSALTGKSSEQLEKYMQAVQASKLLAKQVRQFYGTSITPEMDAQLNQLTNPESLFVNPSTAKKMFNQFKSILRNESGTYQEGLRTPKAYEAEGFKNSNNVSNAMRPKSESANEGHMPPEGTVWMRDASGNKYAIHQSRIDEAKKGSKGRPPLYEVE